jgi:hypothetical protein
MKDLVHGQPFRSTVWLSYDWAAVQSTVLLNDCAGDADTADGLLQNAATRKVAANEETTGEQMADDENKKGLR